MNWKKAEPEADRSELGFKMFIIRKKKDKIISKVLQSFVKLTINDYGKMIDFVVDSKNRTIVLKVLLKGEEQALKITVLNYAIVTEGKYSYFKFNSIRTSREWINILYDKKLSDIFKENKIQIPGYLAASINIIL